jgi:hypothetical protein
MVSGLKTPLLNRWMRDLPGLKPRLRFLDRANRGRVIPRHSAFFRGQKKDQRGILCAAADCIAVGVDRDRGRAKLPLSRAVRQDANATARREPCARKGVSGLGWRENRISEEGAGSAGASPSQGGVGSAGASPSRGGSSARREPRPPEGRGGGGGRIAFPRGRGMPLQLVPCVVKMPLHTAHFVLR